MKRKIYYLSTCSTCKRIMNSMPLDGFILQDIKTESITNQQLGEMIDLNKGINSLFSKRAMKYRQYGLHNQELTEKEMKEWILKEYTFLTRPVIIMGNKLFVGSGKANIEAMLKYINFNH